MKKLLLILALLSTFTFAQRSYVVVPSPQYTVIEKGNATDLYLQWDNEEGKYVPLSIEDFNIATKGYHKEYIALLTQSGTNAPVATVLRNTLGGTLVWSYEGVGTYYGTLASAFPDGETLFNPVIRRRFPDEGGWYFFELVNDDIISLSTYTNDNRMQGDDLVGTINNLIIHIIVFP